jgi:hypothetical protein
MTDTPDDKPLNDIGDGWLQRYYFARATFSVIWVAAAFSVASTMPMVSAGLLVIYPAWDAAANWMDARRHGGLRQNGSHALNVAGSVATTLAVALAYGHSSQAVISVFGAWAILSGVSQLATGVRRWKAHGAQWAMILSGAQSALAGGLFIARAGAATTPSAAYDAPYVAFGAFYFLLSGLWLTAEQFRFRRQLG